MIASALPSVSGILLILALAAFVAGFAWRAGTVAAEELADAILTDKETDQ